MRFLLLFATMLMSPLAQAEFVHTDWKVAGDNKVVLDTQTGLEWLRLSETIGRDIRTVTTLAQYQGWRLPTMAEVNLMLLHFFGDNLQYADYTYRTELLDSATKFTAFFGATTGSRISGAFYKHDNGSNLRLYSQYSTDGTARLIYNGAGSNSHSQHGIFLVSDGGLTLSSLLDPSINIGVPDQPNGGNSGNGSSVDVPAFGGFSVALLLTLAFRRRKSA